MSTSAVHINLTIDVSLITNEVSKYIPHSFDEHGSPYSDKYRWDFRLLQGPTVSPIGGGRIGVSATYYGDLETRGIFGGCHLGSSPGVFDPSKSWVFIILNVSAKPAITNSSGQWFVKPSDISVVASIGPNSDTKCSVFNIDVGSQLNQILNSDGLKNAIANALANLQVAIPLTDLWAAANKEACIPLNIASLNPPQIMCVALNLLQIEIDPIFGDVQTLTIPLTLHIDPEVIVTPGSTCPVPPVPPPNIVVH
jgi:hypothetical protein